MKIVERKVEDIESDLLKQGLSEKCVENILSGRLVITDYGYLKEEINFHIDEEGWLVVFSRTQHKNSSVWLEPKQIAHVQWQFHVYDQ